MVWRKEIELFLYEADKIVSDNYEDFFVLGKADRLAKLAPALAQVAPFWKPTT